MVKSGADFNRRRFVHSAWQARSWPPNQAATPLNEERAVCSDTQERALVSIHRPGLHFATGSVRDGPIVAVRMATPARDGIAMVAP
jgi:hypothetical protein